MEYNQDTPQSATDIMTGYTVFHEVRTEITTFLSKGLMNALTGNPEEGDY